MTDPLDPETHDFVDDLNLAEDECHVCGQPPEAHTGAKLPTDQVLRKLPESLAPRLIP